MKVFSSSPYQGMRKILGKRKEEKKEKKRKKEEEVEDEELKGTERRTGW